MDQVAKAIVLEHLTFSFDSAGHLVAHNQIKCIRQYREMKQAETNKPVSIRAAKVVLDKTIVELFGVAVMEFVARNSYAAGRTSIIEERANGSAANPDTDRDSECSQVLLNVRRSFGGRIYWYAEFVKLNRGELVNLMHIQGQPLHIIEAIRRMPIGAAIEKAWALGNGV